MGNTSNFYKSYRSTNKDSRSAIDAWLAKAITESAQVKIEEARIQFPFNWITYVERLAKAYQQNDKFLDAATCYKSLIKARGAKVVDLFNLSLMLFKAGEMSDSLTYARQAYSKDSQNPTISKVFLECLITTNHSQEALDLALEKLKETPNDNDYKVAIAQSNRLLGNWDKTIEILGELANTQKELRFKLLLADAYGETDSGKALPIYEAALAGGGNSLPITYTNSHNPKESCRLYDGEKFPPIFYYNLSFYRVFVYQQFSYE